MNVLLLGLQIIGWGIVVFLVIIFLFWSVSKLDSATKKMRESINKNHPKYEVRIYRKNGDLAKKCVLSYMDMTDVRQDLKPQYYCEIEALK